MYEVHSQSRICQGDILEGFVYQIPKFQEEEKSIIKITLPFAIVLTQDCDLEQDYNYRNPTPEMKIPSNDKFLQSILICPAYLSEEFKQGNHLSELKLKMTVWGGEQWKYIKQNQNERYHFLKSATEFHISELIIDFKHFYTIAHDELYDAYRTKYRTSLKPLFREDVSHRFANFLSRIGLPNLPDTNTTPPITVSV